MVLRGPLLLLLAEAVWAICTSTEWNPYLCVDGATAPAYSAHPHPPLCLFVSLSLSVSLSPSLVADRQK